MRIRSLSPEEELSYKSILALFPEATLLFPSKTGITKNILDAHISLRMLMAKNGYHDYSKQGQGEEHQVYKPTIINDGEAVYYYDMSLYRPETKDGDPRLWPCISRNNKTKINLHTKDIKPGEAFGKLCKPDDLFAAIIVDSILVLIRITDNIIKLSNHNKSKVPNLNGINQQFSNWITLGSELRVDGKSIEDEQFIVSEIIDKLESYGDSFVESRGDSDMAVGKTVEWMLGIEPNSSKDPDYHGVEIKSARTGQQKNKLTTLFSKTPDRKLSPYKPYEVVTRFGKIDEQTQRPCVYASIGPKDKSRNLMGFFTRFSNDCISLELWNIDIDKPLFIWPLEELRSALTKKHRRTLWIAVNFRKIKSKEEFQIKSAKLTGDPCFTTFLDFIREGKITVDLTMSLKGKAQAVRDHGYLFRIQQSHLDELFLSEPKIYIINS